MREFEKIKYTRFLMVIYRKLIERLAPYYFAEKQWIDIDTPAAASRKFASDDTTQSIVEGSHIGSTVQARRVASLR